MVSDLRQTAPPVPDPVHPGGPGREPDPIPPYPERIPREPEPVPPPLPEPQPQLGNATLGARQHEVA